MHYEYNDIHLVKRPDGGEPESGLGRGAEELQDGDGGHELPRGCALHVDDGVRRLVDDHLGLVAQARLYEVEVGRGHAALILFLLKHLAGDPEKEEEKCSDDSDL